MVMGVASAELMLKYSNKATKNISIYKKIQFLLYIIQKYIIITK